MPYQLNGLDFEGKKKETYLLSCTTYERNNLITYWLLLTTIDYTVYYYGILLIDYLHVDFKFYYLFIYLLYLWVYQGSTKGLLVVTESD